jgi:hypothetical protein
MVAIAEVVLSFVVEKCQTLMQKEARVIFI